MLAPLIQRLPQKGHLRWVPDPARSLRPERQGNASWHGCRDLGSVPRWRETCLPLYGSGTYKRRRVHATGPRRPLGQAAHVARSNCWQKLAGKKGETRRAEGEDDCAPGRACPFQPTGDRQACAPARRASCRLGTIRSLRSRLGPCGRCCRWFLRGGLHRRHA